MTYAVIIHQPGDHSDIIAEYDNLGDAINCYAETVSDPWCRENDVEYVELYEWDGDTIADHSLV